MAQSNNNINQFSNFNPQFMPALMNQQDQPFILLKEIINMTLILKQAEGGETSSAESTDQFTFLCTAA